MNKYGRGSIEAVHLIRDGHDPEKAWMKRMKDLFPDCDPVKRIKCPKICPKGAFLGLCKAGYVIGVNISGTGDDYNKNGYYAVKAVEYLRNDPSLLDNKYDLWREIKFRDNGHVLLKYGTGWAEEENEQLTVVFSLWNEGMIKTD